MPKRNRATEQATEVTDNEAIGEEAEENTEEVTDNTEDDAKKEVSKQAKRDAKVRLRKFAQSLEDEQVKADILFIVGTGQRAARGSVSGQTSEILAIIQEAGEDGVSEMDIFKQFHIGQPEMRNKCRLFLKTDKASERVWVAFDVPKATYFVVDTGEATPDGWDGYDPNSAKAPKEAEL